MSSTALIPVEEYLSTSYRPDCDYVDGEIQERNVGEYEHSNLQTALAGWLRERRHKWKIRVLVEQRIQVTPTRYRVPDVCILNRDQPIEPVFTRPPLVCIEILSPEDRLSRVQERVTDYLNFGVPNVWILDPVARGAYVCAPGVFREPGDGVLIAPGSAVRIPLADLFAELD